MAYVLEGLKPASLFHYFEEISAVPRGSGNLEEISDYLCDFGRSHGYETVRDSQLNVLIRAEATKGYEDCDPIVIQGHMDMVCEKNPEVDHDFLNQGIELNVKGDYISARGTTLGGDDGICLAIALAILDDRTLPHPPLEVLFTTNEETGMDGAFGFDCSKLTGRRILNLDSESEGTVLTSSAGGITVSASYPLRRIKASGTLYCVEVHGLLGGHSGADIHLARGNAIVILGQLLYVLYATGVHFSIKSVEGGGKANAIPNSARAYIYLDQDEFRALEIILKDFTVRVCQELAERDPGLVIDLNRVSDDDDRTCFDPEITRALTGTLAHLPDGVLKMSSEITGFVQTSSNLGILRTTDDSVYMEFLIRSSLDDDLDNVVNVITYVIDKGALDAFGTGDRDLYPKTETSSRYPGWAYRKDSPLRDLIMEVYRSQTGKDMKACGIHAGLECGIFADRIPDVDMVSMGPDILDIHTTKERMSISSAARTYELVKEVLRRAEELK